MKKRVLILAALLSAGCFGLTACGAKKGNDGSLSGDPGYSSGNNFIFTTESGATGGGTTADDAIMDGAGGAVDDWGYNYVPVTETPFVNVAAASSSYFSLDRNTAGYSYVRRQIVNGYSIQPQSVRVEELINYFDYSYAEPTDEAVSVITYLSPCPWNESNSLVTVGVKTKTERLDAQNGNYVFLIDVSGSMSGDDRIGLAKYGFNTLLENLGEGDVVSIVKYASGMSVVADGIECTESNKSVLTEKMNSLRASGSTNGAGGLELAYQTAQKHFITGGNNRVIIISDGDFNVGKSSTEAMKEFIQDKAESGTYLSVIGVGMGNTRDDMLETLASCGNGNYAYLDNKTEAKKVFTHDLGGTLLTVAKDAKAGVTFTDKVVKYRLVGYDTKHITEDEFNDVNTDAGEIGSGLCTTAVYEVTLKEGADGDVATAEVRYKDVRGGGEENKSVTSTVTTSSEDGDDARFAACVAEFGLILRKSEFKAQATLSAVYERLESLTAYIGDDEYKKEFVSLVEKAIQSEKYE